MKLDIEANILYVDSNEYDLLIHTATNNSWYNRRDEFLSDLVPIDMWTENNEAFCKFENPDIKDLEFKVVLNHNIDTKTEP